MPQASGGCAVTEDGRGGCGLEKRRACQRALFTNPRPLSCAIAVGLTALLTTVRVPVSLAATDGENVTVTTHLAPGANSPMQPGLTAKSGLALMLTIVMGTARLPFLEFLSVTLRGSPVAPGATFPKFTCAGAM
jgi:hypothetical protein